MGIAGFAGAGLAGQDDGEGAGGLAAAVGFIESASGGAGGQALKCGLDGAEVVEGVEPVGAAAKLARSLGASEHEKAEDGGFVAAKIEDGANAVLVFGDAGVADGSGEGEIFKRVESLADLVFGEVKDGIAAGALVARVD